MFNDIRNRPALAHATFGVEIYSIDRKAILYEWNGQKLFVPGSTAKLLTEGAALALLGPDYRFHTRVFRTGSLRNGTVEGNLVLIANGDPNLSGGLQPNGTLAYAEPDHSYGGFGAKPAGDPSAALDSIARQIFAIGIRRVAGRILIDAGLFPSGDREAGTGVVISPICVNDNVVDVEIAPAAAPGQPAAMRATPQMPFIHFINRMTTGDSSSPFNLDRSQQSLPDGTINVTLSGSIPQGRGTYLSPFPVPDPSRFATFLMKEALERNGVAVQERTNFSTQPDSLSEKSGLALDQVADLVSVPLRQEVMVTLKVSQNVHAAMMPYVLGGILAHAASGAAQAGFHLEHAFLEKAGLDLSEVAQSDGAGGYAFITPDFMVRYLSYLAARTYYPALHDALPVLGESRSLRNVQSGSVAAGHVYAKTGTVVLPDALNDGAMLAAKGLAGYTRTTTGERVAFAIYLNNVPLHSPSGGAAPLDKLIDDLAGQPLGALAAAINQLPINSSH